MPDEYKDRKVFFLAGPIRGGGGWQMEAAESLWANHPGCIVADPSRWDVAEKMAKNDEERKKITEHRKNSFGIKDDVLYPHQAGWESDHMEVASKKGMLIFWLEKESKTEARPQGEGVYAQDTRVEIGMWLERIKNNPNLNVKIGGHWEIDEKEKETKNSFGGMNFITYYLTGEKDRRKIYDGKINNEHLVLAKNLEKFLEKALPSEITEMKIPKMPIK
ncbi:MAG: hypothetical protein WC842_00730 [Candidatus Paceibacterota bacterium]|jgi:hypothetical protein